LVVFRAFLWQFLLLANCFFFVGADAFAAEQPVLHSPLSPHESLTHIVVAEGLKVEFAAHEPNVIDPVEIRFDEEGRMWVVEMRDYPTGSPDGKTYSRISVLVDNDGDGFFETATVFADNLRFATGLQPWKGGVFVTTAGEIAYMKDTSGDGRADLVETWFRGFAEENTQLRASHPRLALDNHIYVANGLRGGSIVDAKRPDDKPLSISGMDFRFNPLTRKCEAMSGAGQFGLTFDDFGNRFVCTNRNPAIHVVLEDRFLKKNPLVAVAAVTHEVTKAGDESRVFPITRAWTTSNLHAGQLTAACGLEIYRGNALPDEFYGNIFVCEPTGHLVHREIMQPHGVTFTSKPAYETQEFFASRDQWCCPVNLAVGPDGALYVVDMYRAVIEHPEWMPTELRERPDLLDGNDHGRIYRVVPKGFRRPAQPRLSSKSTAGLVDLLAHPNAWWRETAARLLVERQDKSVGAQLERVALKHESLLARIHALRVLHGLGIASDELRLRLLDDPQPRIVEQAIAFDESRLPVGTELSRKVAGLIRHTDDRVRFLAILTGRGMPSEPLFPADSWEQQAMLLAARTDGGVMLLRLLQNQLLVEANLEDPKRFVRELARVAAASDHEDQAPRAIRALVRNTTYHRIGLASFLNEWRRRGKSLETLRASLLEPDRPAFEQAFFDAVDDALGRNQSELVRCEAIDLLAHAEGATETLASLALDDTSAAVRARAIAVLPIHADPALWRELLRRYSHETPALQTALLDSVHATSERTALLLDAIAAGQIQPAALGIDRINRLLNHRDVKIRRRAEQLFEDIMPADRQRVLEDYKPALSMPADAARGRAVFAKHCATCHRIDNLGTDIAPDISDSRERTPEQLLADILQPNRAIDSNYFSYTVITSNGQAHTGILASETSTSITMKQAEGKTLALRRAEIDELYSNGISFMPDGFEKLIPPQDMADLISFIKNWRYLDDHSPMSAESKLSD
jgi:putative membrane-bound dehydrogenase-like protein